MFSFYLFKFRDDLKDGYLNLIKAVRWFGLEKRPSGNTQDKFSSSMSCQWTNGLGSACTSPQSFEEKKTRN